MMSSVTEQHEQSLARVTHKQQILTVLWILIQVFIFAYVWCVFAVMGSSKFGALRYSTIWVLILALSISVGGTQTLRKVMFFIFDDIVPCLFIFYSIVQSTQSACLSVLVCLWLKFSS